MQVYSITARDLAFAARQVGSPGKDLHLREKDLEHLLQLAEAIACQRQGLPIPQTSRAPDYPFVR